MGAAKGTCFTELRVRAWVLGLPLLLAHSLTLDMVLTFSRPQVAHLHHKGLEAEQ